MGRHVARATSRSGPVLLYLFLTAFGYASAVAVAVLVTEGLMLTFGTVIGDPSWFSGTPSPGDIVQMLVAGAVLTAIAALPGFLVAIALAALLGWRGPLVFAVLGAADAALSLVLYGLYIDTPALLLQAGFSLPCLAGGLAGGFVYWTVAGQFTTRSPVAAAA